MQVKFYGTRGSIPMCAREYQDFGGNTTCLALEIPALKSVNIIDAGTGIRNLGKELMNRGEDRPKEITIGFSHFHWDHIQGFPFFDPAYQEDTRINLLAMGKDQDVKKLKEIFLSQMSSLHFPVQLGAMGAEFRFIVLGSRAAEHSQGLTVQACKHNHPGGANSFRIERNGKVLVFCTDIEHGPELDPNIIELARGADVLIHEAQYTDKELPHRQGWGHSSYGQAIEVARQASARHLIMTHHDPDHTDKFLRRMEKKCQKVFPDCQLAKEGMVIDI